MANQKKRKEHLSCEGCRYYKIINTRPTCTYWKINTFGDKRCGYYWVKDAKMMDYLRPQTVFNGKMESYIQNFAREVK